MTMQPGTTSGSHAKLQAGVQLGDYILGQVLWPTRIADAYRANGPSGAATIYVIHAHVASNTQVRDYIIAGTRAAAALPAHKHLVHTRAAGLTDVTHGALSTESVIVSRTGRVKVTDLALGLGTLAAMRAGIISMQSYIAPEV